MRSDILTCSSRLERLIAAAAAAVFSFPDSLTEKMPSTMIWNGGDQPIQDHCDCINNMCFEKEPTDIFSKIKNMYFIKPVRFGV